MSYKNNCLTCLSHGKDMRHLNNIIKITGEDVQILDILKHFYNYSIVQENTMPDDFPQNICLTCVHQLTMTYSFKVLMESSAKTLKENQKMVDSCLDNDYGCDYESDDMKKNIIKPKKIVQQKRTKPKIIKKKPTLFCVECKAQFATLKGLNDHCTANHPVKSTTGRDCDYCNEKFEDFRMLVSHRKRHLKPYLCETCWEGFFNEPDLNSHICQPNLGKKEKQNAEKTLKQCDQCGKSYPPGYIRIHMLTHSSNRAYSCPFCPKKFKVPAGLNSHILWNHKRTRNHKCEVCNATFISSSSKSSHIRKNHLKEKKYACESCGKRFFSKSELQRHSLTHSGLKNFHCHLCEKSYQTRYGLNVHLKSHSHLCQTTPMIIM